MAYPAYDLYAPETDRPDRTNRELDDVDAFLDELFAARARPHLRLVSQAGATTAFPNRATPNRARTRLHDESLPPWHDSHLEASGRAGAGLGRLFLRTLRAVILVGGALAMVFTMLQGPVLEGSGPTSAEPATFSHLVQPGDTLWSLAVDVTPAGGDVGDTVAAIRDANGMTTSMLVTGDRIAIPAW